MHAENPDGLTIHGDLCRHRAARFQIRDMQYAMLQYFSRLAHQYGVPVPSKAVHLHVQRDWHVVAVQFQQMSRNCGYAWPKAAIRSEEHTSEIQSLMRISYAVFFLKKKKHKTYIANASP